MMQSNNSPAAVRALPATTTAVNTDGGSSSSQRSQHQYRPSNRKSFKEIYLVEPEVSKWFNSLFIIRGSSICRKFVEGGGDDFAELTEEEYNMMAYPCSTFTVIPCTSFGTQNNQNSMTFHAPACRGYFTVRDLAMVLVECDEDEEDGTVGFAETDHLFVLQGFIKVETSDKKIAYSPFYGIY